MQSIKATPRYALDEIERRWLVNATAVGDLANHPFRLYEDLYISDSRLRLRRITEPDGNVIYKLGKKYGKRTRLSEPITTLYLDKREYDRLRSLEGSISVKRRYALSGGSLDIYQLPNPGLMIFELEFASEAAAAAYQPPAFVGREVTDQLEYTGYRLSMHPEEA